METNTYKLKSIDWKEFQISELFNVLIRGNNKSLLILGDGEEIPYIGAKYNDNGITGFVDKKNLKANFFKGNAIVFIMTGEGSVGKALYKSETFVPSSNVYVGYSDKLNRYTAHFIVTLINQQESRYNYGYIRNEQRLNREKIILPIDNLGNPNWQFMEDYMRIQEKKLLDKAVKKLEGKILSNLIITGSLSECRWKELSFTEVFSKIQRGKRLTKANQIQGKTPYISSTALNNGVDGFIGNDDNVRKFQNCITLANSGSVGNAFFQQYEFVASDHVTQLKCDQADKYSYLFMLPIISRLSEKYSFNREINDERIKREKLLLPVNEEEEIDFVFMSNFMKNLETETLQNVLKIYNNRLQKQNKLTDVNGGGGETMVKI